MPLRPSPPRVSIDEEPPCRFGGWGGGRPAFMVTYARGSPLDPASYDPQGGSHIVTKVGIDATRKANYPEEIRVPGTDAIDPAAYLVPIR